MYFSSLDFFSNKFRSDLRKIDTGGGGTVTTAGTGVVTVDAGGFEFFFEGVRSEIWRNFKRYGNDGVRNNRILDFFSHGIALSSKNKSSFDLFSFFPFALVKGEEKSEWEKDFGFLEK